MKSIAMAKAMASEIVLLLEDDFLYNKIYKKEVKERRKSD